MNLPPDPDGANDLRAEFAQAAIDKHGEVTGATAAGDADCNFDDLLCNLFHWCDRNGRDMAQAMLAARRCYKEEITDE